MTGLTRRRGISGAVLLVLSLSHTLQDTQHGEVLPSNPFRFINETLTLNCTVTSDSIPGNFSGSLFFVKDFEDVEKVLPMQYITPLGDRAIQLDFPITSRIHQGGYVCKLNKTDGSSVIIGSQNVSVDYRPKKVEKIDCRVFDWRNMTCTWDLGVDFIHKDMVKSELIWIIGRFRPSACPHQGKTSCSWKENDGRNSFKVSVRYQMLVTVRCVKASNGTAATSDWVAVTGLTLVEPAPVHSLTVANRTSRCLYLEWNHTEYERNIMYTVHVLQEQDYILKFNTSEREVTLCDLHPARTYKLRVSCIPLRYKSNKTEGFYSDWTTLNVDTLEDVPSGVPGVQRGSFVYNDCNQLDTCGVTIYWKPVPLKESNGEITLYRIKKEDTRHGTSEMMEVAGSATSYDLIVRKDREYSITLRAGTQVGMSGESKPIVIPPYKQVPYPSDIVVEADSSTLYITWGVPPGAQDPHQGRVTGYTLYYCNGSKITSKCEEAIQWRHFAPDVMEDELVMPGNLDNQLIGVSALREIASQNVSSGIQWCLCVHQRTGIPPSPRGVVFSSHQPDNALSVEWTKFVCAETPIYVSYYVVSHCIANNHGGCAGPSVQVNVSTTKKSQVIQGLSAGVKYRVTLRAVSRSGEGPESEAITRVVVNSDLTDVQIAGIIVGGLVGVCVLLGVLTYCVRYIHSKYKSMSLDITLPQLVRVEDLTKERKNNDDREETPSLQYATFSHPKEETPVSDKKTNTDNTLQLTPVGKMNAHDTVHETTEGPDPDLETFQQMEIDLKPGKPVDLSCSGEEREKTDESITDGTEASISFKDSYLELHLSVSDALYVRSQRQEDSITGQEMTTNTHSGTSPYLPLGSVQLHNDSTSLRGHNTNTKPQSESNSSDSPHIPLDKLQLHNDSTSLRGHNTNTKPQSESNSSDSPHIPLDKLQLHNDSTSLRGHNTNTKPQSESNSSDSPHIPLDKLQLHNDSTSLRAQNTNTKPQSESNSSDSPQIPLDKLQLHNDSTSLRAQNTNTKPQSESNSSDSPQIPLDKLQLHNDSTNPRGHNTNTKPQSESNSSDSPYIPLDKLQLHNDSTSPRGHNTNTKPQSESNSSDSPYIPLDKLQPPPPPVDQKKVSAADDEYVSVSDTSQKKMSKPGFEKKHSNGIMLYEGH
ncbi:uncharacterized protein LOC124114809 [Haliotis rufescens]|uniref:uncharacterized protein LOC124114809 n=1 Tax=Haliotis rufescens TaxID=6454 RepID=UPI00201E9AFC|nr:uncharacterized protein LOC124114809 [Haliotis rufescens]